MNQATSSFLLYAPVDISLPRPDIPTMAQLPVPSLRSSSIQDDDSDWEYEYSKAETEVSLGLQFYN